MHLYHMKLDSIEAGTLTAFLEENFVGFAWPGIGSLEQASPEQLISQLAQSADADDAGQLPCMLEEASIFLHAMEDGDYLLLTTAADDVYLGDLGDYFYVDNASGEPFIHHRRGVTWIRSCVRADLHKKLQAFLSQQSSIAITRLEEAVTHEEMVRWMSNEAEFERTSKVSVSEETIAEALEILTTALRSDDLERRERAAIAILQYAR